MKTLDIAGILAAVSWGALIVKAAICTIPALPPVKVDRRKRL